MSYLDDVQRKREEDAQKRQREAELKQSIDTTKASGETVAKELQRQHAKDRTSTSKVEVTNPPDLKEVTESINKLNLTAFTVNQDGYVKMVQTMTALAGELESLGERIKSNGDVLDKNLANSIKQVQQIANELSQVRVPEPGIKAGLKEVVQAVKSLEIKPEVTVEAPVVNIPESNVDIDLSPLLTAIADLQKSVRESKVEIPKQDFKGLESAIREVKSAINNQVFPVPNYILPFKDADGKAVQVQLDGSGNLPITGGGGGTQYNEDSAHASGNTGTLALVVANETQTNFAADGDYVPIGTDRKGRIYVRNATASDFNTVIYGYDGSGNPALSTNSAGELKLDMQHTEGDTVPTAAGILPLWKDSGDGVHATGTDDPLPVNILSVESGVAITVTGDINTLAQFDLANSDPLAVALVDASGDQIASLGSGVQSTFDHGSNLDVDTTAEQLPSQAAKVGVTVKAGVTNTGIIYVGNSDVTAGTNGATDGFELVAGESITLPVNNANLIYVIGSANNQKVFWIAV